MNSFQHTCKSSSRYGRFAAVLALGLFASGWSHSALAQQAHETASFVNHMQTKIQALRVRSSQAAAGELLRNPRDLVHVYDRKGYTSIWSDQQQWHRNAHRMMNYMRELPRHGLDPHNYHFASLQQLLNQVSLANRIHADLLLSDAFISLATDLKHGAALHQQSTLQARQLLLRLKPSLDPSREFDALLPSEDDYWALSSALKQLLQSQHQSEFETLDGDKLLSPGQRDEEVLALRRRLQKEFDLPELASSEEADLFDPQLSEALKLFQHRNGLEADGLLGPSTRAVLNRGHVQMIQTLSLNLERWRQLAPRYGDSHIRVNVAAQELAYVHQGQTELRMKVIAGKTSRPTPSTHSRIREIVFNPYWNVPTRIAVRDKLPQIKSDPEYLLERGFSVRTSWAMDAEEFDPMSIDWEQVNASNFNYYLRQDPGPKNALGAVKFLFPNDYSVYLHDTPTKDLFERGRRLFSSGCVRLDQPMALAQALLRNHSAELSPEELQASDFADNHSVILDEAVEVHLEYWTAWVDHNGDLKIRPDAYQRDPAVLASLRDKGAYRGATQLASLSQQQSIQLAANLNH